jgi:DNA invertase Pin-like site-specific DNA recombinase
MAKTVGYLRVSTADQDVEKNKADILKLANDKKLGNVTWSTETASGVKNWRKRKFGHVFENLRSGDTIIVPELSRLGRSTLQILEIMKLAKEREIAVHAVKGGWSLKGSMESKIVLTMRAMFAEIERDLISERTKEGLKAVKERGVKLGRPKGSGKSKLDVHHDEIIALLQNGSTKSFVAKKFNTSQPNLYNWLKKNNISAAINNEKKIANKR